MVFYVFREGQCASTVPREARDERLEGARVSNALHDWHCVDSLLNSFQTGRTLGF